MRHDPSKVDYNSPDFERGLADGKAGRPCTPLEGDVFHARESYHSYIEGWLMGDSERDEP